MRILLTLRLAILITKRIFSRSINLKSTRLHFLKLVVVSGCTFFVSTTFAAPDARQIKLLTNNCIQCHVNPESTAPIMGVTKDWEAVLKQGEEETLRNVVLGVGGMPPLGYCSACSEDDLRELVRLIVGFADE
jgi:cytochrome c5